MKCLLDLSAIGLEPDGRRAHLIPYENRRAGIVECTLVLDYKGIVELMRRSGDVVKIHSDVVCDNDTFSHSKGEVMEHTYDLRKPRGDMFAAYTEVTFKDGSTQSAIMSQDEIESIRSRSKSGKSGPWVTDYNEMAKKTTLRRVSKLVTLSPEIRDIVDADNEREFEMRNVTQRSQMRSDVIDPFQKVSDLKEEKRAEIALETQEAMNEALEDAIGEEAFADE